MAHDQLASIGATAEKAGAEPEFEKLSRELYESRLCQEIPTVRRS